MALVLSRKLGESIVLTLPDGREIRVMIAEIDRGKIRLAIQAPREIDIWRSELVPPTTDRRTG